MLQIWDAHALSAVVENGNCKPLVLDCTMRDRDSALTPIFVKLLDPPDIGEEKLFREVFGNLAARMFGVDTPEPCLVYISKSLADSIGDEVLEKAGRPIAEGWAAGCEYIEGLMPITGREDLEPVAREDLVPLYGFDLAAQNYDRIFDNPNCAVGARGLTAFDFETCFELDPTMVRSGEPWEVDEHDLGPYHVAYDRLRRRNHDWEPVVGAISRMTDEQILEMTRIVPMEWRRQIVDISQHIKSLRQNLTQLRSSLNNSVV